MVSLLEMVEASSMTKMSARRWITELFVSDLPISQLKRDFNLQYCKAEGPRWSL